MLAIGQNIRYRGVNCALGPSKSICNSGDFVIAGFVIAGFVSTYFTPDSNRSFAGSGHMVQNKLHWDANDAVGLPKQKNS